MILPNTMHFAWHMVQLEFNVCPINRTEHLLWHSLWNRHTAWLKSYTIGTVRKIPDQKQMVGSYMVWFFGHIWTSYSWHPSWNKRASRTPIHRWTSWLLFHCWWKSKEHAWNCHSCDSRRRPGSNWNLSRNCWQPRSTCQRISRVLCPTHGSCWIPSFVYAHQFICISLLETTG